MISRPKRFAPCWCEQPLVIFGEVSLVMRMWRSRESRLLGPDSFSVTLPPVSLWQIRDECRFHITIFKIDLPWGQYGLINISEALWVPLIGVAEMQKGRCFFFLSSRLKLSKEQILMMLVYLLRALFSNGRLLNLPMYQYGTLVPN